MRIEDLETEHLHAVRKTGALPRTAHAQRMLREALLEARLATARTSRESAMLIRVHYRLFMAIMAFFCPDKDQPLPPMSRPMLSTLLLLLMVRALHDPGADHANHCVLATELLSKTDAVQNEACLSAMEEAMALLDGRPRP